MLFLSRFCQRKSLSKGSNSLPQFLYITISANHLVILPFSQAGNVLVFHHFLFLFHRLIFMSFRYFPYTISLFCSNPFSFFFFLIVHLFIYLFIYLFIHFWLCWIFVSVRGLSPVAASGGHSSSRRAGLSLSRPLLLWSTGSRRAGSVVVAHGPSCSVACGIFPDQGSNPCLLHWQADSQPLRHQGSPSVFLYPYSG